MLTRHFLSFFIYSYNLIIPKYIKVLLIYLINRTLMYVVQRNLVDNNLLDFITFSDQVNNFNTFRYFAEAGM